MSLHYDLEAVALQSRLNFYKEPTKISRYMTREEFGAKKMVLERLKEEHARAQESLAEYRRDSDGPLDPYELDQLMRNIEIAAGRVRECDACLRNAIVVTEPVNEDNRNEVVRGDMVKVRVRGRNQEFDVAAGGFDSNAFKSIIAQDVLGRCKGDVGNVSFENYPWEYEIISIFKNSDADNNSNFLI